jgi:hypothetical protein
VLKATKSLQTNVLCAMEGTKEGTRLGAGAPPPQNYRRYRAAYDPDLVVNLGCLGFSAWRACSRPALLDPLPAYGAHALTGRGGPEKLAASHETESPKSVTPFLESQGN